MAIYSKQQIFHSVRWKEKNVLPCSRIWNGLSLVFRQIHFWILVLQMLHSLSEPYMWHCFLLPSGYDPWPFPFTLPVFTYFIHLILKFPSTKTHFSTCLFISIYSFLISNQILMGAFLDPWNEIEFADPYHLNSYLLWCISYFIMC